MARMNRDVGRIVWVAAGIALSASGLARAGAAHAARAGSFGLTASLPVYGFLTGVAATSARNAWAVGQINSIMSLILHWTGRAWQKGPSLRLRPGLMAVTATSATNTWAVGQYRDFRKTLILHRDGRTWKR